MAMFDEEVKDMERENLKSAAIPERVADLQSTLGKGGMFDDEIKTTIDDIKKSKKVDFTIGETIKETVKAGAVGLEHLAGSVGKLIEWAGESEGFPGARKFLDKHTPAWTKTMRDASSKVISDFGRDIGNEWERLAATGMEAPSEKLKEARRLGWRSAPLTTALTATAQAAAPFAGAIAAGVITKNPQAGILVLGSVSGAGKYHELREKGIDKSLANTTAMLTMAWEMATEQVPFNMIFRGAAKPMLKRFLKVGTTEAFQEFVQNTGENYLTHIAEELGIEEKNLPQAMKIEMGELFNGWFESITAGFLLAGGASMVVTPSGLEQDPTGVRGIKDLPQDVITKLGKTVSRRPQMGLKSTEKFTTSEDVDNVLREAIDNKQITEEQALKFKTSLDDAQINEVMREPDLTKRQELITQLENKNAEAAMEEVRGTEAFEQVGKEVDIKIAESAKLAEEIQQDKIYNEVNTSQESEFSPESKAGDLKPVEKVVEKKIPAAKKLLNAMKAATAPRAETLELRKQEQAKRFAKAGEQLQSKSGTDAFYSALKQLKGELPQVKFELPDTLTDVEVDELVNKVNEAEHIDEKGKINTFQAVMKLMNGKTVAPFEVKLLHSVFGAEFAKTAQDLNKLTFSPAKKVAMGMFNIMNLQRAIRASYDFSAAGRQGLKLGFLHPKIWAGAVKEGYQAFTSKEISDQIDMEIRTGRYANLMNKAGLDLTHWEYTQEEQYSGEIIRSMVKNMKKVDPNNAIGQSLNATVGLIPRGLKASERAYTTTLNRLRADVFNHYANQWDGQGVPLGEYKKLASFINHMTGRGGGKWLQDHGKLLSMGFWSPRLQAGRLQVVGDTGAALFDLTTKRANPHASKVIAQSMAAYVSGGMLIMSLCALAGAAIERDPRSSDFGKVVVGKTRIDIWGGYVQFARLAAQLATGERKTGTGRVVEAEKLDIVSRFLQSKLSPAFGTGFELMKGKTFEGEVIDTPEEYATLIFKSFTPLVSQDMYDALKYEGLTGAAIATPLAIHGIGIGTYEKKPGQQLVDRKNEISQRTFGKDWDNVGVKAQEALRAGNPIIDQLDRQARLDREDFGFIERQIKEQYLAGKRVIQEQHEDVRQAIKGLDYPISGLSRRIGSGYYLNDEKFEQYQSTTSHILQRILPKIVGTKQWNRITDDEKRLILDTVIGRVKKEVRNGIIKKSNVDDLITLIERKKQR